MLTRREFVATSAVVWPAVKAATSLYSRSFVLDCNTAPDFDGKLPPSPAELKLLRDSGLTAVKATLGGATGSYEDAVTEIAFFMRAIEYAPDALMQIRTAADLDAAKQRGKLGLIFSFEAASMLGSNLARLDTFRNLGVLVMQLTYNRTTPFGVGCLDGETGGLTPLGREAAERMNALGIAIDLSHSNTQTTAEGIAASKKPVIISHAGCRAVYMHPRNKEDRELRALAERGGVIGIYMLPFLTASPKQPMLADYLQHMTHAIDVCGEDHVGVGSDVLIEPFTDAMLGAVQTDIEKRKQAGVSAPGEDRPPYIPDLNTPRKIETIADALTAKGYRASTVEKIIGGNFRRVFREVWA
jgi:membrane dipeptidase